MHVRVMELGKDKRINTLETCVKFQNSSLVV